jgi:RNA polymerase sigma factor (sigma-70 family)
MRMFERRGAPGGEEQFTALYEQSFDYVYAFILARCAGDRQMAEEIVQETFASAWAAFTHFRGESSGCTWLCSIARHKLMESYRRAIRRGKREQPCESSLATAPDPLDLEAAVLGGDTQISVVQALGCINALYRYALVMRYMDDSSVPEIAKALGRTYKAADGILQRAKAEFTKHYTTIESAGENHA